MEIPNRQQLDREASQALAIMSDRHRNELRRLLGSPPDVNNVPREFWLRVRKEVEDEVAALLLLVFIASGDLHGGTDMREQGLLWSGQRSRDVADVYTQTSIDMLIGRTRDWQDRMDRGESIPTREVNERLEEIFGRKRAEGLAETEITEAQTAGGERGIEQTLGKDVADWWDVNPDVPRQGPCKVCAPLHGQPRSAWTIEVPTGPPAHPRCHCTLRYVAIDGPYNPSADGLPVPVDSLG